MIEPTKCVFVSSLRKNTLYVGTRTILALKINQTSKKFQITYLGITYTCISKIHVHFKWNCHFITLSISFVNWLEIGISPSYVFRQMDNRIRIKLPMYIEQLIICTCWLLGISLCVYRHWDQYLTVCHSLHDLHRSQEKVNINIMVIPSARVNT